MTRIAPPLKEINDQYCGQDKKERRGYELNGHGLFPQEKSKLLRGHSPVNDPENNE
jgi:hypothetical protein